MAFTIANKQCLSQASSFLQHIHRSDEYVFVTCDSDCIRLRWNYDQH